jgi:hypothetical protein
MTAYYLSRRENILIKRVFFQNLNFRKTSTIILNLKIKIYTVGPHGPLIPGFINISLKMHKKKINIPRKRATQYVVLIRYCIRVSYLYNHGRAAGYEPLNTNQPIPPQRAGLVSLIENYWGSSTPVRIPRNTASAVP